MKIIWFLCRLPYDGWVGGYFTHIGKGGELLVVGGVCDDVCPCACDLREEVWLGFVFFVVVGGGGRGGGHVDVCMGESFFVGGEGGRREEGRGRGSTTYRGGEGGEGREKAQQQQHHRQEEKEGKRGQCEGRHDDPNKKTRGWVNIMMISRSKQRRYPPHQIFFLVWILSAAASACVCVCGCGGEQGVVKR